MSPTILPMLIPCLQLSIFRLHVVATDCLTNPTRHLSETDTRYGYRATYFWPWRPRFQGLGDGEDAKAAPPCCRK